ncbi:MAG: hypothetical protein AAFW75_13240, partial [Cyanobacteria bacterium J06636_16]
NLQRLLLKHFDDIFLLMTVDDFNQLPGFNIAENCDKVLMSFTLTDFIDADTFNVFPFFFFCCAY